jgi:hypothetical protein
LSDLCWADAIVAGIAIVPHSSAAAMIVLDDIMAVLRWDE